MSRAPDLGERELAVLEVLWVRAPISAQSARERLAGNPVSLSTVQSTLERLHRKKLAGRKKRGRAYEYWPRVSRSSLIGQLLRDLSQDLAGGAVAPMLSGFMEYVGTDAPELEAVLQAVLEGSDEAPRSGPDEAGPDHE